MFLRGCKRIKDGKEHLYWSIVENRRLSDGRVAQRHVLYLGDARFVKVNVTLEGKGDDQRARPDFTLLRDRLGEHLIRYYGWYSNKQRGQRAKRGPGPPEGNAASPRPPSAREARQRWAALIRKVCETDPLACPQCGSTMKIIGFIERHQGEVIEKILRHCGLWEEAPARAPPPVPEPTVG